MNIRITAGLCAALTAVCAAGVQAQTAPAPSPSPSVAPEIGRVQTADRHDEAIANVVKSIYVVTKETMLQRGDVTITDALEHVPGVNVQRNGPLGTLSDITIDGYRTSQILLLIDGRPAAGQQISFADVGSMPTTGIERIEVVEGGGATLYGNGALGGVINIITEGGAGLRAQPNVSFEGDSLGGRAFAFENGTFSFERRVSPNNYSYPSVGPVAAGTTLNDDDAMTVGRLTTGTQIGAFRIGLDAGIQTNDLGSPGDAAYPPLSTTARENTSESDAKLRVGYDTSHAKTTLEISGTTLTSLYTFNTDDPAYIAYNLYGGTTQVTREGRVQASLRDVISSETSAFVAGIDLARGVGRVDDGLSPQTLPFAEAAVYAQESLMAHDGARLDFGLRGERDGAAGGLIAPSLGGRLPLGDGLDLRANYSTGFHAPTIIDLAYPVYSNPDLRPERSRGGDLALDAPELFGGASLRWFVENGNDLIAVNSNYNYSEATTPTNPYLINVAKYAIAGFVGSVRTRSYHGLFSTLAVTDTYRALDLTTMAQRLARRPVVQADATLEYGAPHGLLQGVGFLAHSVGAHDTPDTQFTTVDGYLRVRAMTHALVSLRVFNIGDKRYADVSGYPLPGRVYALQLSTR